MDPTKAVDAVAGVGEKHGFEAMLIVILLVAIGAIAFVMVRAHIRRQTRLAEAQEASYQSHTAFAMRTQEATTQMADATKAVAVAIEALASNTKEHQELIDQLHRQAEKVRTAATQVINNVAEIWLSETPNKAAIFRRIADELSKD